MRIKNYIKELCTCLAILLLISTFMPLAYADPDPGTDIEGIGPSPVTMGSIIPHAAETGKISLSMDGLGVSPGNIGIIQVDKPAGATVRKAYMAAATTGFKEHKLVNGDIKIDDVDVAWGVETPSSINSWNYWADVTSIVTSKIDAASAGRVNLNITEPELDSYYIDGEILAVIFDDPNQATDNTIVLLFGAQDIAGDTFTLGLDEPIDTSDPNLVLDMSLGISYSYQGMQQYSTVDVNGNRLTTSAGGQDDASAVITSNGAILTVGGLDDSNTNPPNPLATPTDPRSDDELYTLIPFVSDGDTAITVHTTNPSNSDNIFFASLFLASTTAVVGEGVLLAPVSATNPVGTHHTVTATVQDDLGNPIVGSNVTFEVVSGPHVGEGGTATTDTSGEATFTYTGTSVGTDAIEATMVDRSGNPVTSNQVTKEWYSVGGPTVESALVSGTPENIFQPGDPVYAVGSGYATSTTYNLYILDDQTWPGVGSLADAIVTMSVTTDASGDIPTGTLIWTSAVGGKYSIVVDVNGNGDYDAGTDALGANIGVDAGVWAIPEFITIAIPAAMILGMVFLMHRRKRDE
jgi:hypothetical protein